MWLFNAPVRSAARLKCQILWPQVPVRGDRSACQQRQQTRCIRVTLRALPVRYGAAARRPARYFCIHAACSFFLVRNGLRTWVRLTRHAIGGTRRAAGAAGCIATCTGQSCAPEVHGPHQHLSGRPLSLRTRLLGGAVILFDKQVSAVSSGQHERSCYVVIPRTVQLPLRVTSCKRQPATTQSGVCARGTFTRGLLGARRADRHALTSHA